jgi:hypothetical protein
LLPEEGRGLDCDPGIISCEETDVWLPNRRKAAEAKQCIPAKIKLYSTQFKPEEFRIELLVKFL